MKLIITEVCFICSYTVYALFKNFSLYRDVTIAGEGLQNLGLRSGPLSRGIFIVPHLL
jgi:hypothetical protein